MSFGLLTVIVSNGQPISARSVDCVWLVYLGAPDLILGQCTGEYWLMDLTWLLTYQFGQGGGRHVQFGCEPWPDTHVTILRLSSQLEDLFHSKLFILRI